MGLSNSDHDWKADALCCETGGDWWFVEQTHANREAINQAKAVCALCHVRQDCLEYALVNDERYGIWGGMTTRAREKLRRRRGMPRRRSPIRHGTETGYQQHRQRREAPCVDCVAATRLARSERRNG